MEQSYYIPANLPVLSRAEILTACVLASLAFWALAKWFLRVWRRERVSLEKPREAEANCDDLATSQAGTPTKR